MKITMPRGDLRHIRFSVENPDGTDCDVEFDEIYVTFKKKFNDAAYLFQKTLTGETIQRFSDGTYQFSILPTDTDGLKVGDYVFDIELMYRDQIKQTTVGSLALTDEVTYAQNEG